MVSSFSGVWLYENHGTPDDYDTRYSRTYPLLTGLHLGLAFALTIMGPGEVLGVLPLLVAALRSPLYHLLPRMAERCTIKSTYIHLIELWQAQP